MVAARRKPWDSPSNSTRRQGTPRSTSAAAKRSDWSAGTTGSSTPWSSRTEPETRSAAWMGERAR